MTTYMYINEFTFYSLHNLKSLRLLAISFVYYFLNIELLNVTIDHAFQTHCLRLIFFVASAKNKKLIKKIMKY